MWFWKIMRRFFLSLDSVLFNFIDVLYDLLMSISRTSILTQGEIAQFAQRIELLLGIFMLFKLSFSLITYVVNPDDFSDKQKGFGKLIQSAVISLLMLVLVPYAFQMAFNLQTKILEGNILAKLILGEDEEADGNDNFLNTAGEEMAFSVMLPFFKPNYSISNSTGVDLADCINIYEKDDNNNNVFSQTCKDSLRESGMETTPLENYSNGITERSLGLTFRIEAALSTTGEDDTEDFLIDYMAPISTVVAVVVCLLLVTFCIDIGVRNVKLAFLQLIYPIPVISYMDPKSGKDGLFKKWYQMCFSTFLSLFIRLLALYFGVYIISKVGSLGVYDVVTGSQITNGWVMIFVIIGVLMFIKQLPKILENLGIKLDGDGKFTLNPLKKIEEGAIGGKKIIGTGKKIAKGAAIGAGGAALAGGASLLTGKGRGTGRAMRSALTGGLKGNKFGKNFTSSYAAGAARKKELVKMKNDGVKSRQVVGDKLYSAIHGQSHSDKVKNISAGLKAIQDDYKSYESTAAGVDAIAKDLDKRRKAAEAAGNYAETKKWSDEFDKRVKEIAQNKGLIYSDAKSFTYDATGNYQIVKGAKGEKNATLQNISKHMTDLATEINEKGKNISGFTEVAVNIEGTNGDIKKVKNTALGSQQSIDTNTKNRHYEDVAKYSNSNGK